MYRALPPSFKPRISEVSCVMFSANNLRVPKESVTNISITGPGWSAAGFVISNEAERRDIAEIFCNTERFKV